jgi:hypothetical protein
MGKVYLVTTDYDTGCGRGGEEKNLCTFREANCGCPGHRILLSYPGSLQMLFFNENFYNTVISCSTDQLVLSGNHSSGLAAESQGKYRLRKTECDFISDF